MTRPPSGNMVWWRYKKYNPRWRFGYCTYLNDHEMIHMGCWNGDTVNGPVVSSNEIEWKEWKEHLR